MRQLLLFKGFERVGMGAGWNGNLFQGDWELIKVFFCEITK